LAPKKVTTFNEEFILISERCGLAIFVLVLAAQCLVFVFGALMLAASVSRQAFFLFSGVDPSIPAVPVVIIEFEAASQTHTASVEQLRGHTVDRSLGVKVSSSTSDSLSLTAYRLFSETKV